MSNTKYFSQYQTRFSVVMRTITLLPVLLLSIPQLAIAQITPDATLGSENSSITSGVNSKNESVDLIKGGATRGSSLFHSFSEFNINNRQKVYFDNPPNINNIFSRVTGNNVSNILGTLGVNGSANLYLLNPHGIIFGQNAQLDIKGSFFATTANSFTFPDGSEFSATNPQMPLLTMSVPSGVQFGSKPGDIRIQGNLTAEQDLTLKGENLDLQGKLTAGKDLTFVASGNIQVSNTKITSTSAKEEAGNISLTANGDVSLKNSQITSNIQDNTSGYSKIQIKSETGSIYINGSTISAQNKNSGYAGDIYINASDLIEINNSKINAEGNFGRIFIGSNKSFIDYNESLVPETIEINNSHLTTTDKNQSSGNTEFTRHPGLISITANDRTTIANNSSLESRTFGDAKGGSIDISTGSLFIRNSSKLDTSTSGKSSAGNINIHADTLTLETQGSIISTAQTQAQGSAGDIFINSPNINLSDKAIIAVDSISPENTSSAGTITLNTNFLKLENAFISAKNASGNGGDIFINTQILLLRNDSEISSKAGSTENRGNGGKITINAEDGYIIAVPTEDSDIIANAFGGTGGEIKIKAVQTFGLTIRKGLNTDDLKKIPMNGSSDISASSDIGEDGEVNINTLDIDPSQGLVAIPTNLIDPSKLIAQGCNSSNSNVAQGQSEFVITGRGGIPPSPDDALTAGALPAKWVIREKGDRAILLMGITPATVTAPLVEAQGMVRNANGDIVLIAQPVISTDFQSGLSSQLCGVAQKENNQL